MLEKHLWNSLLLYLVVEVLQLVHEIRYSIKEEFWKTSQNSNINPRSSHREVFCQKIFLKSLQNSHKKIFAGVSFLRKLQAGNFKPAEVAAGENL